MALSLSFIALSSAISADVHASCGNCRYQKQGSDTYYCNTGSDPDVLPTEAENKAGVVTTANLSSLVGAMNWDLSFCGEYLSGFKTPNGQGSVCVRDVSSDNNKIISFLKADEEARILYYQHGTSNGYPHSLGIVRGGVGADTLKYGTGQSGDVPPNWCSIYMKQLLCSIAFPQVISTDGTHSTKKGETPKIRPVFIDDCYNIFTHCNRRQPTEDETDGSFIHDLLKTNRAKEISKILDDAGDSRDEERAFENDLLCDLWEEGHGLAAAGTALGEEDDFPSIIKFEAAGSTSAGLFIVTLVAILVLVL